MFITIKHIYAQYLEKYNIMGYEIPGIIEESIEKMLNYIAIEEMITYF